MRLKIDKTHEKHFVYNKNCRSRLFQVGKSDDLLCIKKMKILKVSHTRLKKGTIGSTNRKREREKEIERNPHLLRSDFAIYYCVSTTKPPALPARYPSRYVFSCDSGVVLRSRRRSFALRCIAACSAIIRSVLETYIAVARSKYGLVHQSRGFIFPIRPIASISVGFKAFAARTRDSVCHETIIGNYGRETSAFVILSSE